MNVSKYIEIMKNTLQRQVLIDGFCFLLGCIWIIIASIRLVKKSKCNPKKAYFNLTMGSLLAISAAYMFFAQIHPLWQDIKHKQIVEAYGSYYFDTVNIPTRSFVKNAYANIEINGKAYTMDLPAGWSEKDFPFGTFDGKIVYAKESKIILEFIPNDQ